MRSVEQGEGSKEQGRKTPFDGLRVTLRVRGRVFENREEGNRERRRQRTGVGWAMAKSVTISSALGRGLSKAGLTRRARRRGDLIR